MLHTSVTVYYSDWGELHYSLATLLTDITLVLLCSIGYEPWLESLSKPKVEIQLKDLKSCPCASQKILNFLNSMSLEKNGPLGNSNSHVHSKHKTWVVASMEPKVYQQICHLANLQGGNWPQQMRNSKLRSTRWTWQNGKRRMLLLVMLF